MMDTATLRMRINMLATSQRLVEMLSGESLNVFKCCLVRHEWEPQGLAYNFCLLTRTLEVYHI